MSTTTELVSPASFDGQHATTDGRAFRRGLSLFVGGTLALLGARRRGVGGLSLALLGSTIALRAARGRLPFDKALPEERRVRAVVTIARPRHELYAMWRDLERLPTFLRHVDAVRLGEGNRSHWVARGPMGSSPSWDAEIIWDQPPERLAWRSVEGSEIRTSGEVEFREAPGGRGTELEVTLTYVPPAGRLGVAIAKAFGEEPAGQLKDDLRRFKQIAEAGEIPTIQGQPQGA